MRSSSIFVVIVMLSSCSSGDEPLAAGDTAFDQVTQPSASLPSTAPIEATTTASDNFGSPIAGTTDVFVPMATPAGAVTDSCNQDVDLVYVLDVSGSMIPPLTNLLNEAYLVDEALGNKELPSPQRYGLVLFVDNVMVTNGGMPYEHIDALLAELEAQIALTNIDPGRQLNGQMGNLTWPENSLDALYAAATEFQWRPAETTLRSIILLTDASFWDLTVSSSGHDSEVNLLFPQHAGSHGYDETIEKLREQMIWVNTFAAKTGGPPDGMVSPPSHGEWRGTSVNVGVGFFEPYAERPSIAESTGGFAWDIDEIYDGAISLANPINESIEVQECAVYLE